MAVAQKSAIHRLAREGGVSGDDDLGHADLALAIGERAARGVERRAVEPQVAPDRLDADLLLEDGEQEHIALLGRVFGEGAWRVDAETTRPPDRDQGHAPFRAAKLGEPLADQRRAGRDAHAMLALGECRTP